MGLLNHGYIISAISNGSCNGPFRKTLDQLNNLKQNISLLIIILSDAELN